jgi:putative aldouronate transport system substrate-binding protein
MKKRIIPMLLAIALLLTMFAGCGTQATTQASSAEPAEVSEAEVSQAEVVEEQPSAEAPEQASQEEASSAEEPAPEALYSFPLEEPITLTAWAMWVPGILEYIDSAADNLAYAQAAENTGVTIDFDLCASDSVAATNFNLIIASGDYPDLFCAFKQYYNYGEDQAVSEDILVPFDDYLDTYMPNLSALMEAYPDLAADITTSGGHVCTGYVLRDPENSFYSDGGLCIRKDWLDECGLDVPTTFDEFESVMLTLKDKYNPSEPLWVNQEASVAALTQEFYGQEGHNAVGFYIDDDWNVQYQMLNEDSDQGLKIMNHYYDIGLISGDFITNTNQAPDESAVAQGEVAAFATYPSDMESKQNAGKSLDENFSLVAVPSLTEEEGATVQSTTTRRSYVRSSGGYSISTSCEYPEIACMYIDYWYGDEGKNLANWGVEGETYVVDENGENQYTDLISNNPQGMPTIFAQFAYLVVSGTMLYDEVKDYANYSAECMAAPDVWNSNVEYTYTVKPALFSTVGQASLFDYISEEDVSEIYTIYNDINTYQTEIFSKAIIGQVTLDDALYADFAAQVEQMGLETALEIYNRGMENYIEANGIDPTVDE